MKTAITMRELQKAGAIKALNGAQRAQLQRAQLVNRVLARIDAAAAKRSSEQIAALEELLGEREEECPR